MRSQSLNRHLIFCNIASVFAYTLVCSYSLYKISHVQSICHFSTYRRKPNIKKLLSKKVGNTVNRYVEFLNFNYRSEVLFNIICELEIFPLSAGIDTFCKHFLWSQCIKSLKIAEFVNELIVFYVLPPTSTNRTFLPRTSNVTTLFHQADSFSDRPVTLHCLALGPEEQNLIFKTLFKRKIF